MKLIYYHKLHRWILSNVPNQDTDKICFSRHKQHIVVQYNITICFSRHKQHIVVQYNIMICFSRHKQHIVVQYNIMVLFSVLCSLY